MLLEKAVIKPKHRPPVRMFGDLRLIQSVYHPPNSLLELQVDLLIAESEYHRTALSRRVATRLPQLEVEIDVLACEDLILHKLLAGRIVDRADCAALLKANRPRLDLAYLLRWASTLNLTTSLSECWNEVYPGESFDTI